MTADDTTHADCEKFGVPSNRGVEIENTLDLDEVCKIISCKRRRRLIFVLATLGCDHTGDDEPQIPVGDVAEIIAEAALNESTDRKAVYIALIQNHLSKLDEAGVITYDERGKTIQPDLGVYLLESLLLGIEQVINSVNAASRVSE